MKKPKLIIFDVNETLLNLDPLKEKINVALNSDGAFDLWFRTLLHYSLVESITQNHVGFSKIGVAVFKMIAKSFGKKITDNKIDEILSTIKKLHPHDDVIMGLKNLKDQDFSLVALTNGSPDTAKEQLAFAKIDHLFDRLFSVDEMQRFKPHADTYNYVLKEMNISKNEALLVAAHGWDIAGAQRAGLMTCFVERPGKFEYPLAGKPTLRVQKIDQLPGLLS